MTNTRLFASFALAALTLVAVVPFTASAGEPLYCVDTSAHCGPYDEAWVAIYFQSGTTRICISTHVSHVLC